MPPTAVHFNGSVNLPTPKPCSRAGDPGTRLGCADCRTERLVIGTTGSSSSSKIPAGRRVSRKPTSRTSSQGKGIRGPRFVLPKGQTRA